MSSFTSVDVEYLYILLLKIVIILFVYLFWILSDFSVCHDDIFGDICDCGWLEPHHQSSRPGFIWSCRVHGQGLGGHEVPYIFTYTHIHINALQHTQIKYTTNRLIDS